MYKKYGLSIFIIIGLCLCGCSYNISIAGNYETLDGLTTFVYDSIDYLLDADGEYFQSPKETEEYLLGDCEDYTIIFMFLAHRDLDVKTNMQIIFVEKMGYHSLIYYNGVWYDPTNNYIFEELPETWHEVVKWPYGIVMIYATGFYTKNTN